MSDPSSEVSVLVLAASLDPGSRSYLLAKEAVEQLKAQGQKVELFDLRQHPLPLYPGEGVDTEEVGYLRQAVHQASHILFAVPVYNFDVNAAAKNVVEWLTTHELEGKTIGFLLAAGGRASYMSVLPFANSLMLDFRCWIVPRFVYAVGSDFSDEDIVNAQIKERITLLTTDMFR